MRILLPRACHFFGSPSETREGTMVVDLLWVPAGRVSTFLVQRGCSPSQRLTCWMESAQKRRDTVSHPGRSLSGTDTKPLLLHEGDSALLRRIQRVTQGALTIDHIGEIVPDVGVDLVDGWSPLEIDIHLRRPRLEHLADDLVAIKRLRSVQQRRV